MKGYLVRVGIDQAFGKWNAPIDAETGDFVYVPIPEKAGTAFQPGMAIGYEPFRAAVTAFSVRHPGARPGVCTPPEQLNGLNPHLDPDFERLTYGDNGLRRGRGLCDLAAGDVVVFFAGLRPIQRSGQKLIYGIIGFYRVSEAVRLRDIPSSRWAENAHTRKIKHGPDDIIIRAQSGVSGRLSRAIPIGEYRDGAYRVCRDLLAAWGDLTCRDGFIQRSAVPPAFRDPPRFLEWFEAQSPELVAANNPGRRAVRSARPALSSASATPDRADVQGERAAPIILVHLRQPNRGNDREARTDPLYEFGSFGLTGCHRTNLLNDVSATGARLGFIQPGRDAMRLVYLSPPVRVVDHGRRREATWSPAEMPLCFAEGVLLIDNEGNTDVPELKAMLAHGQRHSWVARFSSAFRSRTKPLPQRAAAQIVEAWRRRCDAGGRGARAAKYWEALPYMPPRPDTDRAATRARLLVEARGLAEPAGLPSRRPTGRRSAVRCSPRRRPGSR